MLKQGSLTVAQTDRPLATKHFMEHTVHSKAPLITSEDIERELLYIESSIG
jgi:hypothetical protein